MIQVAQDLRLRGVALRPLPLALQVGVEAVGVVDALDVAARTWIAVPVPRAAHAVGALQHDGGEPEAAQAMQHVEPREPGAHHDDVELVIAQAIRPTVPSCHGTLRWRELRRRIVPRTPSGRHQAGAGQTPGAMGDDPRRGGFHDDVLAPGAGRRVPHLLAHRRRRGGLGRLGRPLHRGLHLLRALLRSDAGPRDGAEVDQAGDGQVRRDLHGVRVAHDRRRPRAGHLLHAEPPRSPRRPGHIRLPRRVAARVRRQRPVEARRGLLGLGTARGGNARLAGGLRQGRPRPCREEDALELGQWSRMDAWRAIVGRASVPRVADTGWRRARVSTGERAQDSSSSRTTSPSRRVYAICSKASGVTSPAWPPTCRVRSSSSSACRSTWSCSTSICAASTSSPWRRRRDGRASR